MCYAIHIHVKWYYGTGRYCCLITFFTLQELCSFCKCATLFKQKIIIVRQQQKINLGNYISSVTSTLQRWSSKFNTHVCAEILWRSDLSDQKKNVLLLYYDFLLMQFSHITQKHNNIINTCFSLIHEGISYFFITSINSVVIKIYEVNENWHANGRIPYRKKLQIYHR